MSILRVDNSRRPITSGSEHKYGVAYQESLAPLVSQTLPGNQMIGTKYSKFILPASRENLVPLPSPSFVSQVGANTNFLPTVGKNMAPSEAGHVESQSSGARPEHNTSHNIVPNPDLSITNQSNSASEQTVGNAPAEKKSNIILPASRESLVPLQPPPSSRVMFRAPNRISPAFPTAPKVMVRKFNLAYSSQINTHAQNKLSSKLKNGEDPKDPVPDCVSPVSVSKSDFVSPINSDLCNNLNSTQPTKANSCELNSVDENQSSQAVVAVSSAINTTVAIVTPTLSSQKTSMCIPAAGLPLKLVPTILKRNVAKTVLTPSGLGTAGSIPSTGPKFPVILKNSKPPTVLSFNNKPVVSLEGRSVITKDNKVFNIKIVDGKCVLHENVNSETNAVSEVSNHPKVSKQVDLKMLSTPKFIKVGGYILKRCVQRKEDTSISILKQNMNVMSEREPESLQNVEEVSCNTPASTQDVGSQLSVSDKCAGTTVHTAVLASSHIPQDTMNVTLEWDANEILNTLETNSNSNVETSCNIAVKQNDQSEVIGDIPNVREVIIPARRILVVDACSQTDLYSLVETGKIVDISISPAAKYGIGSVTKKQNVPVSSTPVAIVERIPPVHFVAPCVQDVQLGAESAKLDIKGTEECIPNKGNITVVNIQNPKFPDSCTLKEVEPIGNTTDSFDRTLWEDLMKNCSATEIEPDQLLMMESESTTSNVIGPDEFVDNSSVHDLIVKHNINKLSNKNKLVKNDGPCGEEYYNPRHRKRKQSFSLPSSKKLANDFKEIDANIPVQDVTPILSNGLVSSSAIFDDPKLKSVISNQRLLHKLYCDWRESVQPDTDGNIELHYAVTEENVNLVRRQCIVLSAQKVSVDVKNNEGETPLHLAVRNGHKQITQILLSYGADPCMKNDKGNTALHLAVLADSVGSLQTLLIKSGSWILPLDVLNDEGLSPLHLCAMNNKNKQLLELLAAGANVNLEDGKSGRTALFHAVEANNNQIVRILLAAGADSTLQNYSGHTPLHAASEVSVTDKRVMSELITNEGIYASEHSKMKRKFGSKANKCITGSEEEDDPKTVRGRRISRDSKSGK